MKTNLSFRYPGRSPILKDISFELNPGERVGLFAPVGTGKSTLVDLIQKFYLPELGEICFPFLETQTYPNGGQNWPSCIKRRRFSTVLYSTISFSAAIPKRSKPRYKSCRLWAAFHSFRI